MTKTRKTIGVMVGGITDDFTRFLCKGLREAAKEQDVNMVVLPGKFLDRDYAQNTDIMYEYQYDTKRPSGRDYRSGKLYWLLHDERTYG